jgi:hypothetical protein
VGGRNRSQYWQWDCLSLVMEFSDGKLKQKGFCHSGERNGLCTVIITHTVSCLIDEGEDTRLPLLCTFVRIQFQSQTVRRIKHFLQKKPRIECFYNLLVNKHPNR